jgi:hypothetical protein
MQDPVLELHDSDGNMMVTNNNWREATNASDVEATGLAPTNDVESAILISLPAGNYTSIVRGAGQTTGIALNEVFKLSN